MLTRRQFLHADIRGNRGDLRPPWSLEERRFREKCTGCGDCILACPEKILVGGKDNYPKVNFALGACTFCGECVKNCETGALNNRVNLEEPWQAVAYVESHCLTKMGSWCSACVDKCGREAISISAVVAREPIPEINLGKCNGCGACVRFCPVGALSVRSC